MRAEQTGIIQKRLPVRQSRVLHFLRQIGLIQPVEFQREEQKMRGNFRQLFTDGLAEPADSRIG